MYAIAKKLSVNTLLVLLITFILILLYETIIRNKKSF